MNKNDGGPAFPPQHDPKSHPSGMTLRDYFAAAALTGMLQDPPQEWEGDWDSHIAKCSYEYADAMLAERAK